MRTGCRRHQDGLHERGRIQSGCVAKRGKERIIATVFGGRSTATRNKRVAELLDLGFERAATNVAFNKPALPNYQSNKALAALRTPKLRPRHLGTAIAREEETASAIFDAVVTAQLDDGYLTTSAYGGDIESYVPDGMDAGPQVKRVPLKRPIASYANLNLTEETRYGLYLGQFGTKPRRQAFSQGVADGFQFGLRRDEVGGEGRAPLCRQAARTDQGKRGQGVRSTVREERGLFGHVPSVNRGSRRR